MKLESPITIVPSKYTDQNTNKVVNPPPIQLDSLDIIYLDNPVTEQYYVAIKHLPHNVLLFSGEDYQKNPDITKSKAQEKLLEISKGDLQKYLQEQFPKTLEDEPYGPGSILASMFSAIGIKSSPTCSCRKHALEMNKNGIEWCEENLDTICGWLEEECKKRKIPYVDAVAKMVVKKAINKAKKYRNEMNNEK
jgi:hypothetical protein